MTGGAVAAIDLGASSGRVVVGHVGQRELHLEEVHRFANGPIATTDGLRWPSATLRTEIIDGLRRATVSGAEIASIGVDGWGVDYGLIDAHGALVDEPFAYRDERTASGVERVHGTIGPARLYEISGLQHLPFNTLFQLVVDDPATIGAAGSMALIPDLVGLWLSGEVATERTNASTTGLLDARSGGWSWELIDDLAVPRRLFTELADPGDPRGVITAATAEATGLPAETIVTHVGSHDTASAVVGVPAAGDRFAYISCGTWGLVGVELDEPILTEASRAANFTNERGVDGRIRYLRNVMGLWLLQESMRTWSDVGTAESLEALLEAAAAEPAGGPRFDPDDATFLPPGDMPARVARAIEATGAASPKTRPALVRSIIDSLADAFARAVEDAARLSGRTVDVIHLVGGGARNALLCQATADASGRPVVAGPVEATAIGNVLVQARSHGWIDGDLDALRRLIAATQPLRRFEPRPSVVGGISPMTPPPARVRRRFPRWSELRQYLRTGPIRLDPTDRRLASAATIWDLRSVARRHVPRAVFDYVDGAAETETSLQRSREAFTRIEFVPRVLQDVSKVDLSTTILGRPASMPLVFAPTGFTRLMHQEGEPSVGRVAGRMGIPYALSTLGTTSPEDLALAAPDTDRWFQLYLWNDRDAGLDLVRRARAAGYTALILTVDTPVAGARLRDVHNGFTIPPTLSPRTLVDIGLHPGWWFDKLTTEPLRFAVFSETGGTVADLINRVFDPTITIDDFAWLRQAWDGPLVIKGIQTVEDARAVVDAGADAIVISNHGGRQLDRAPTPLEQLPSIVAAVGDRAEVYIDGGVLGGADVIAAVAMGARAVLVGRAYLYGLMAGGERGVQRAGDMLRTEMVRTMQLLGARQVADLAPDRVRLRDR